MEPAEVITPSGHKVYIKQSITYGEEREIEKASVSRIVVDPTSKKMIYDGSSAFDAEDLSLKLLVVKVIDKDGHEFTGDTILPTILSWGRADAKAVYGAVDKVIAGADLGTEAKKKLK